MEPGDRHGAGLLNLEGFLALVVVPLLMELMDLLNLQEHYSAGRAEDLERSVCMLRPLATGSR